jgi:hypothetical protein
MTCDYPAKEALRKTHKPLTSENISSHFEHQDEAPQKTMRQRRKTAQNSNKQSLPTIEDDLKEEIDTEATENPLLDLELSYEDDLFE